MKGIENIQVDILNKKLGYKEKQKKKKIRLFFEKIRIILS
jgi:hypothetical protein